MASCQHCGNPLTKTPNARNAPFRAQGMAAPEQPELPAWLETLRAGERPASSAAGNTGAASFFGADLIDEGALPSWMRPERAEHIDNTPSGKYPALRPASAHAPNTDGAFPPAGGMAANSLIDEQSLPLWMQGEQQGSQYQGRENISAASLVQPGALPDWITSLESQTPAPTSPASSSSIQYPQAAPGSQPIAARDLIDQQALPGWMAGQNTPPPASGQGFAASSLLDPHALPAWMREENQQQRQSNVEAIQSAQSGQIPNYQAPIGQGPVPNTNNNLVDANALPEWLRTAEGQRQGSQGMASYQTQQGFTDNPRQATFGVPPRPDNLRVPGRPRGEMEYLEESEVAANTFASMLGVASVAPNFPGQQPNDAFGRSQPPAQYQQSMPQAYSGSGMPVPGPQRQQGQMGQSAVGMPPTAYPGMAPGQGYAPNQPQTSAGYPGGYQMGGMPGVSTQPPMANNTAGKQPGSMTSNDPSNANKKPARRGFLSTILDWFSLSR
jgi:hypothetical protein